jgi:transposase
VLVDAQYGGYLQTDAAAGLGEIGPPGRVISLGCHAHLRRPFYQAVKGGEKKAQRYLEGINRLFRIERLAKRFKLSVEKRQRLRDKHSRPLFQQMAGWAKEEIVTTPPKTEFSDGLHYLLAQQVRLERCLTVPQAELSNNGAENSIRPLKLGAKNWIGIGHPNAGARLANLFTLVENCRQAGLDPETYLIEVIARLADHPAKEIGALSPWKWKPVAGPLASTTVSNGSGSGPGR